MLRAEVRTTYTMVYRGYAIEVSRGPIGWRAGVYPSCTATKYRLPTKMRRSSRRWIASIGCSGTNWQSVRRRCN
jgi:hypothetical protein